MTSEDIYVLTAVYYTAYEEDDNEPCHRYFFYMKGDLFEDDKLQVRGDDILMAINDD